MMLRESALAEPPVPVSVEVASVGLVALPAPPPPELGDGLLPELPPENGAPEPENEALGVFETLTPATAEAGWLSAAPTNEDVATSAVDSVERGDGSDNAWLTA